MEKAAFDARYEEYRQAVEAYFDQNAENGNMAELIIAKNRHGETGKIDLRWDGRYTRFFSVDRSRE